MKKYEVDRRISQANEKEKAGVLGRVGSTILEVLLGAPTKGAIKSIEGIYDAHVGAVGAIGGIFSKDFKENLGKHIAFDATGWLTDAIGYDKVEDASFLDDGKVGNFVRDVEQGIGGMAPSVALSAIPYAGAVLGPVSMGMAAGGNNMESALQNDAGYYNAWLYGIGSGVLEGAIESVGGFALGKSSTLVSKMLSGTKLGKFASSGLGEVAETFISEAGEEMASDLADPALKYATGIDKNIGENYKETIKGLPRTALLGGTIGSIMGGGSKALGGVRNSSRGGFKASRADNSMEYISKVSKYYDKDVSKHGKYDKAIDDALYDISRELTAMSKEQRTNYMSTMGLYKNAFNEDGSIKSDLRADINTGAVSSNLRAISATLKHKPLSADTELTDGASKAKSYVEKMLGEGANVVVTSDSAQNNAFYNIDEGIVYINNNAAFSGEEIAEFVATHEVAHITEGTRAYGEMALMLEEIAKDPKAPAALKAKIGDIKARKKQIRDAYAGQMKNMDFNQREYLVETEYTADLVGILLGDEYFIEKLAQRDASLVEKIFNKLKSLNKKSASVDRESAKYLSKLVNKFGRAIKKSQGGVKISQLGREDEEKGAEVENERKSVASSEKPTDEAQITLQDVQTLRTITQDGKKKSINDFTSEDIQKAEKWARKFYKELGIKSPFFRSWYGDWRSEDKSTAKVVEHSPSNIFKAGKNQNIDTGKIISWSRDIRGETSIQSVGDKKSNIAVNDINAIVENAVYLDTVISLPNSKSKMPNTSFMHSFYTIYEELGEKYLLKLYVEEALSNNEREVFTRAYKLKDITKVANLPNSVLFHKEGLTEGELATTYSISDLFKIVKQYDKDFNPKPVNKAFLNEDGAPKVLYHGTNAEFYTFKNEKIQTSHLGEGFYFVDNKEIADSFASRRTEERGGKERVVEAYIRAEKVFDVGNITDEQMRDFLIYDYDARGRTRYSYRKKHGLGSPEAQEYAEEMMNDEDVILENGKKDYSVLFSVNEDNFQNWLKENNYDCLIVPGEDSKTGVEGNAYVIFDSKQIKSATDNIGTFDGDNPDIRYSKSKGERFTVGRETEMRLAEELVKGYEEGALSSEDALRKLNALGYKTGINTDNALERLEELIPEIREHATSEREAYRESNRKDKSLSQQADSSAQGIPQGHLYKGAKGDENVISNEEYANRKGGYTGKNKVRQLMFDAIDGAGILENAGDDVAFVTKDAQKDIISTVFSRVNSTYEYNKKNFSDYVARRIMESVIIGEGKMFKANAQLKKIMHRIDISSVEEHISKNDKLKITSRWKNRNDKNAISIADAAKELNDLGFQIPMTDELQMLEEINNVYENTREYIENEMGEELSKRIGKEEYEKTKNKLENDVLAILEGNRTDDELASRLADVINKHQKTLDRFRNYRENFRVDENRIRAEMTIVHHARQIKTDIKNHKYTPAQQSRFEEFKGIIAKIARLEVRGNINRSSAKEIVADLNLWYTKENELLVDAFSESIREDITYFRDDNSGEKVLTINELNRLSRILAHLKNVFVNFGKIYRAGKWVELSEVAHKMYRICSEAINSQTTLQRLFNRGQYFASPLAVASIWDGHDPNGEFTRYIEDLQHGQLNVAMEKMKIAEKLEEIFKKDKKLFNSLVSGKLKAKCGMKIDLRSETVEEVEIPAVNLVNLYLCTRTMSPEDFTLEKVGYAVKVDNSGKYTYMSPVSREEIKNAYEALPEPVKELAMWILEWNNTEGKKMKYEQDIRVNGVSNVISGDYWHLKRLHFEGTNDMQKLFGSRGIGNHGFNKERIKQASSMLIIDNFIEAFLNHTEELFQYKYIDITIKNFDKIVQANVNASATGNKGFKSVKMLIEEQEFYHGTINKDKTAFDYTTQLALDVLKQNTQSDAFNIIIGNMRAGYASFALGVNPKVLATQFSSLIAGFGELNATSVLYGGTNIIKALNPAALKNLAQEVDTYCGWAKVRHFEKGATKAMTLVDKWSKWREVFSKPIELFDRLIVMLEFEACKKEAQSKYGLKIGTEENKIKAGELLTEVGLKTQQNQYESTKSAAIRSKNEIMKGFTMFKTDAHMILSGLAKSLSAWSVLNKKIKLAKDAGDTASVAELEKLRNQTRRKVGKYTTVVILSCAYMTLLARLFNKLYHQDEDDEMTVGDILLDVFGNFLGMFPIVSEISAFFLDGYDVDNSVYSSMNNALEAIGGTVDLVKNAIGGKNVTSEEIASTLRKDVYALGQIFGVPARNIYKNTKAVIDLVSPSTGDKIDAWFKAPSEKSLEENIKASIEKGNDKAVSSSLGLLYDKYDLKLEDAVLRREYDRLMRLEMTKAEDDSVKYSPLEAKTPSNLTVDGEEVELLKKDINAFKNAVLEAEKSQASIVKTAPYKKFTDEERAYALRKISQFYYEETKYSYTGEKSNFTYYAKVVGIEDLALILAYAKNLKGDARQSRREKIEAYIKGLGLNAVKTSLALRCLGYSDKDNDELVKGYVGRASVLSKEERAELLKVLE